ncbi:hypothetical protein MMC29_001015 [Sticta canariensis]|nr:hypothetical protein [Sticta canariensis]
MNPRDNRSTSVSTHVIGTAAERIGDSDPGRNYPMNAFNITETVDLIFQRQHPRTPDQLRLLRRCSSPMQLDRKTPAGEAADVPNGWADRKALKKHLNSSG